MRTRVAVSVVAVGLVLIGRSSVAAQQPPPIDGVTGTVAIQGTVQQAYGGAHIVIVKTINGIEHLFHLTERMVARRGTAAGDAALRGLDAVSQVVVQYSEHGETDIVDEFDRVAVDGLKTVEGVVTNVDRRTLTLSIRLADGSRQSLRLTAGAAADVGKNIDRSASEAGTIVVHFSNEAGRPVAHSFTRVS
jgi:hypothetical protein